MTQDEIIEMAKLAGFKEQFTRPQDAMVRKGFVLSGGFKGYKVNNEALEAFVKLVASAAIAKEREACAKLCADDNSQAGEWTPESRVGGYFAAAIRARGEA
jgi:hypothetical protein